MPIIPYCRTHIGMGFLTMFILLNGSSLITLVKAPEVLGWPHATARTWLTASAFFFAFSACCVIMV